MLRTIFRTVLAVALVAAAAPGQSQAEINRFATEARRCLETNDTKTLDKLIVASPTMPMAVVYHFTNLRAELWGGKADLRPMLDFIKASWQRAIEGSDTLEEVERWIDGLGQRDWQQFTKARGNIERAFSFYLESTAKDNTQRKPFEDARDALMQCAKIMQETGNKAEAADAWHYVADCLLKMPDRSPTDRQDIKFALEQFIALRDSWHYTDQFYLLSKNTLKGMVNEIADQEKKSDKRKSEGYDPNAKGIDALVMPGVAEVESALEFKVDDEWEDVLDYCQRGGPVPVFWWNASFGKDQKDTKLAWFRRSDLYLIRQSASKFAVTTKPSDEKTWQPVDVSAKGKPSKFFLDDQQHVPYAMFLWMGSDRERLGEAEVNLAPSIDNTPVYYRSAASWTVPVAGETLTLYDDNTSGLPMDGDPFSGDFKMASIGFAKDDPRARAPLMDSMRVGKGPRQPYSDFVKIGDAWHHIHRTGDDRKGYQLGTRPLNPEYLKPGRVKLVWSGPKPTAPEQLVIAGRGDYLTAFFDVASGKEIEVPSGEYTVVWGRIASGKGARVQMGTIYGADSKPFTVEADKTTELKMGAPFTIEFTRAGDTSNVTIDGTRIWLKDSYGCAISELHNMCLAPEVFASKMADGKGAKQIDKFQKLSNADLLNAAAVKYPDMGVLVGVLPIPNDSKDGDLVMRLTLPAAGMRVGLKMKKHPLFGKLDSDWK